MIQMIGTDYQLANVEKREKFSMTKKECAKVIQRIVEKEGVLGCVLLSTCNRTELYISSTEKTSLPLIKMFWDIRENLKEEDKAYIVQYEEEEAVRHLYHVCLGLCSQVLGDEQIIGQVGEALQWSRENKGTNQELEVLFRIGMTGAKELKSQIPFFQKNPTLVSKSIQMLKDRGILLQGKKCLVIGNGTMGKLAAVKLLEEGADVTVTVRQYRSGHVEITKGAKIILYGDRMAHLKECSVIVSATQSPNYTITKEEVRKVGGKNPLFFLDLAMPRDIDPKVGELSFAIVYSLDSLEEEVYDEETKKNIFTAKEKAEEIVKKFFTWKEGRDFLPNIEAIMEESKKDFLFRTRKLFSSIENREERQKVQEQAAKAAKKVSGRLLFQLRDKLEPEEFRQCLDALEDVYGK